MKKKFKPDNIVIFRTDRIGEVLLSTVAVSALKKRYPDAEVSFVTSRYSKAIVEDRPDVKDVIVTDISPTEGVFSQASALAAVLRGKKFDTAVVLNPHKVTHLACFLAGIPVRAGFSRKWGFLLNLKAEDERSFGKKHEVEYTMDLMSLLDASFLEAPKLFLNERSERTVEDLLREKGVAGEKPLIAVHPSSSNPAKMWPAGYYVELIKRLKTDMDCKVLLLGSMDERELAEKIERESGVEAINLAGELDLKALAALLSRVDVFVGNDTGPMHMAAAVGAKVVVIFGRNIPGAGPRRWRPWGEGHVVFHETVDCDRCYDKDCPYEYKCLRAVKPDAVFEAVKKAV